MTPDEIRRLWDDDDTPRSVFPEPLAERLTRENKELRRWKVEATEVILGLQDLGKALGIPLGERITGPVAVEAAQRLRAEVERLHALLSAHAEDAREDVAHWGGYASDYFAEKWHLDDDIAKWERRRNLNAAHAGEQP